MDKIDRNTGLKKGEAIDREMIRRLLDKSDELVEGYNRLKEKIENGDEKLEEVKEWYKTHG